MRDVVRRSFYAFNVPFEGDVPYFYQDLKGLVSIGVGLLCDPIQLAMNLPLVHPDGHAADRNEIAAEWLRIKNLPPNGKGQTAAQLGHLYAKPYTRLRLTQEGLEQSLMGKLTHMDRYLAARFPEYEAWPSDAQLAVLSLSWACGPAFKFPKCEAAMRARDWVTASVECFMPEEKTISGLRPRNKANKLLFLNAEFVETHKLNPDVLHWPRDAAYEEDEEVTQPSIRLDLLDTDPPPAIVHRSPFQEPDDDPPPDAA